MRELTQKEEEILIEGLTWNIPHAWICGKNKITPNYFYNLIELDKNKQEKGKYTQEAYARKYDVVMSVIRVLYEQAIKKKNLAACKILLDLLGMIKEENKVVIEGTISHELSLASIREELAKLAQDKAHREMKKQIIEAELIHNDETNTKNN
jgi:hypothetical protein